MRALEHSFQGGREELVRRIDASPRSKALERVS
jgi:hypothetical protein